MVQTWQPGTDQTHTCPHCGTVYAVTVSQSSVCDQADAYCDVCGEVMAEWNGTAVPSFKLVRKPVTPPSDEDNPE